MSLRPALLAWNISSTALRLTQTILLELLHSLIKAYRLTLDLLFKRVVPTLNESNDYKVCMAKPVIVLLQIIRRVPSMVIALSVKRHLLNTSTHGWPSTILRLTSKTSMFDLIVVVTSENVKTCSTYSKMRGMISSTLRLDTRIRMDLWRDPTERLVMPYAQCYVVQIFRPNSGRMPSIIISESTTQCPTETMISLLLRNVLVLLPHSTIFVPLGVVLLLFHLEPNVLANWKTMRVVVYSLDSAEPVKMQSTTIPIQRP